MSNASDIKKNNYSMYKSMRKKTNDKLSSTIMGYLLWINKVVKWNYSLLIIKKSTTDDVQITYSTHHENIKLLITDIYDKSETYIINEIISFCSECYRINERSGWETNIRTLSIILWVSERQTRAMVQNILKKATFYSDNAWYNG
jgi:hypothetical protein